MPNRIRFEMTEADYNEIIDACQPVPYLIIGGVGPSSPQERANAAWCRLGNKMGFDGMTVEPSPLGKLFFTAIETPLKYIISKDGNQFQAVRPDFINLAESTAGFGDTEALAIADLELNEGIAVDQKAIRELEDKRRQLDEQIAELRGKTTAKLEPTHAT